MLSRRLLRSLLLHLIRSAEPERVELLRQDVQRWPTKSDDFAENVVELFLGLKEFRTLFFYRIKARNLLTKTLAIVYRPQACLYLRTPFIGPGIFIQHGFATTVGANRIGKNFWVNQQVTVGFRDRGASPTIGDDVRVGAGAIIIGDISIGDRAVIGAGAVVVKSVPSDCTVVGNPAYIVRRKGARVRETL